MRVAFGAVVLADILFFLNNYIAGIAVFTLAQVVLIIRHGAGIGVLLRQGWSGTMLRLLIVAVSIGSVNFLILKFLFVPHATNPMFPVIAGYSLFLCCSLWTGIAAGSTDSFPEINARYIAAGLAILYLGDLMVGLNLVAPHDCLLIISTSRYMVFLSPRYYAYCFEWVPVVKICCTQANCICLKETVF